MEIMPDHVHLLIEADPQSGIHRAVKRIKGRTSKVLRDEFSWLRSRLPSPMNPDCIGSEKRVH